MNTYPRDINCELKDVLFEPYFASYFVESAEAPQDSKWRRCAQANRFTSHSPNAAHNLQARY